VSLFLFVVARVYPRTLKAAAVDTLFVLFFDL